jgi:hypothetical protein
MPPETKIDCETKKHPSLMHHASYATVIRNSVPYGYDIFCLSPEITQPPT